MNYDYKKILKIIIPIIILIFSIFLIIKFPFYWNEKKLFKYIKDNNFTLDKYNIYTLVQNNNNIITTYKVLYDNYYFTKCVVETNGAKTTKYTYYYTKDNEIIIEYENSDFVNNKFTMETIVGTYKNNKLIKCDHVIGNLSCDNLNEYANNYNTEINNITNTYNINLKYLKDINLTEKNTNLILVFFIIHYLLFHHF